MWRDRFRRKLSIATRQAIWHLLSPIESRLSKGNIVAAGLLNGLIAALVLFCLLSISPSDINNPRGPSGIKDIIIHPALTTYGSSHTLAASVATIRYRRRFQPMCIQIAKQKHILVIVLLVLAGDVEVNPGPRQPIYPCGICARVVKNSDKAVCCDGCNNWIHNKCSGLSDSMYNRM